MLSARGLRHTDDTIEKIKDNELKTALRKKGYSIVIISGTIALIFTALCKVFSSM